MLKKVIIDQLFLPVLKMEKKEDLYQSKKPL